VARPRVLCLVAATLGAAALLLPGTAHAASCTRYASSFGSDRGSGTRAHPFRTVHRLVRSLPAGATGCLSGRFGGRVVVDHRLVLRSRSSRRALIVGGVTLTPSARGAVLQHIAIRGSGSGRAAVLVNADRARIVGDTISGTGYRDRNTACVLLAGSHDVVVDGNRIQSCTRASRRGLSAPGIFVGSALRTRISNNVVVHTAGIGIVLGPNAQRTRVVHNLVDGNAGGVLISGNRRTSSSHNVVLANIFSNSGGSNVAARWASIVGRGNVVASNCLWHGFGGNVRARGVQLRSNVVTSPRFVDRPSNYTVTAPACVAKRPSIVRGRINVVPAFRVSFHVRALPRRVQIVSLGLTGLASGARLAARCVQGCSAHWSGHARRGSISLPMLNGRWLPVGAAIDVRATRPGRAGAWARISISGLPNGLRISHACLAPGHSVAVSCRGFG
jgi:hypothetical protein